VTVYARVTELEIDPVRIAIEDAVALYERDIVPVMRELEGYLGCNVLTTPEGKALLVTFWETDEQAEAGGTTGFYPDTLTRYATLFKSPPGRDRYLVAYVDDPAHVGL
jgi:hypothetical protein